MNFLIDFSLTFLVELIIALIFIRAGFWKVFFYVFLINLFSWPIAQLIYGEFGLYLLTELGVILVEGILIMFLFEVRFWKGLLVGFIANSISMALGLLILS